MALMAGITLLGIGAIFVILSFRGWGGDAGMAPNLMIWRGIRRLVTNG